MPTANSQPLCVGPNGEVSHSRPRRTGSANGHRPFASAVHSFQDGCRCPDGNIWFTEMQTSKIGRITTTGAITEFALAPSSVPRPTEEAATISGLLKMLPTSSAAARSAAPPEFVLPTSYAGLGSIVQTDGALWFTEQSEPDGQNHNFHSVVEYPVSGMRGQ